MAHSGVLPALALLCVLFLVASVGFAPRASGQAEVPTHVLGDAVAFGVQVDLGPIVQPSLDQLKRQFSADPNVTVNELNFTGTLDAWHTEEVTEVSAYYGVREETAFGVEAHLRYSVTARYAPVAGTYLGDTSSGVCIPPIVPTEIRTVTANLDLLHLQTSSGVAKWGRPDFALQQTRTNETVDLFSSFVARGVPEIDVNMTLADCRQTVTYRDLTYRVTADVDSHLVTTYLPALDLFDFPMADGENWTVNSTQTLSGTLRGTIDMQGIDPADEEQFFAALIAMLRAARFTVGGLDGFPIVLERVSLTLGLMPYLKDGVLSDISSTVAMRLQAKVRTKTLADNNPYTVYEISEYTPTPIVPYFACYYSPVHGFVVGCGLVIDAATGNTIFELKNVPPTTAEQNIETTKATYVVASPGNPLADFFLKFPYIGLFLVVAAVVVIAALLSRRRRKAVPIPPSEVAAPPPRAPTRPPEEPSPEEL